MKKTITKMMKIYMVKLGIRTAVFCLVRYMYITDKQQIMDLLVQPVYKGVNIMHLLWVGFMAMMLTHLFPRKPFTMALLKNREEEFVPVENYSRLELLEYIQDQNIKAWKVMLVWLIGNGIVGLLYACDVLDTADLMMLTVFFFLCDYICILFYCPFQSHIMGNKCCVNCRIYDWGHFMMFTPMMFIRNFYAVSLFLMSCVVLVHWELIYARNPHRFYRGSNSRLQCINCKDRTCRIKNKITRRNISENSTK